MVIFIVEKVIIYADRQTVVGIPPGGHAGLAITYNYGPCSRSGRKKSTTRIFLQDQSRVRSINDKSFTQYSTQESVADRSPNPKLSLNGDGNFLVEVGIGRPRNNFRLIIDTGSQKTWVKCSSSKKRENHSFNPSLSTSYSYGPCISSTDTNYNMTYADKSSSEGVFGCDEFTLDPDVFPKFQFGCSRKIKGDFGSASGMLGLAQGEKYSLLSQTASNFKKKFSYCLPPVENNKGYLLFGDKAISSSPLLKFTPLLNPPSEFDSLGFYFVEMIGISLAKKRLNISSSLFASPGTIIDSGTVITRLPAVAYEALRAAFRQEMLQLHCPSIPPPSDQKLLDTCYNIKSCGVKLPEIVLHFGGEVEVSLDPAGILWGTDGRNGACLAFAEISDYSYGLTIIGNRQQVSLKVAYDIEGGRVGFGNDNGCKN